MRKSPEAAIVVITKLIAAVALRAASALAAALAFSAIALIVPGTGTHNINPPNAVVAFPRDRGGVSYKPSVLRGRLAGMKMGVGSPCRRRLLRGLRSRL